MRKFNGYMDYRFVCDNCKDVFGKGEVVEDEICPNCKEGTIQDKSEWVSPEQHRENYYDIQADEYCDNGGKW